MATKFKFTRMLPVMLITAALFMILFPNEKSLGEVGEKHQASSVIFGKKITANLTIVFSEKMTVSSKDAATLAFNAMKRVNTLMSPFDPKSDIGKLNAAKVGEFVEVDPLTWRVVMKALAIHRLSGGAYDITVGPIMKLYDWKNAQIDALPAKGKIAEALKSVGSQHIIYEREKMRLAKKVPGMFIVIGSIAKGFAIDQAREALLEVGVENAIIECGGELWAIGEVPREANTKQEIGSDKDRPWNTAIRHPREPENLDTFKINKGDRAIATSGDYEKYFEVGEKRYSHILDPRTGYPMQGGIVGVTIISPRSCMEADALATAVSVLGETEGENLLKLFPGVEAIMLSYSGDKELIRKHVQIPAEASALIPEIEDEEK